MTAPSAASSRATAIAHGARRGSPDADFFNALQTEVNDKGFLVTSTEDLFQWARTGIAVVDDLRPGLLRGRDDPRQHAALRHGALRRRPARIPAPVAT